MVRFPLLEVFQHGQLEEVKDVTLIGDKWEVQNVCASKAPAHF